MEFIKKFLKPSKGKIVLSIVLFVVFIFLGASHVQICKMSPCPAVAIYSYIVMFITLWPFMLVMLIPPFSKLLIALQLVPYLLWVLYYYIIASFWIYKKDTWKIKNRILLLIAILVIIFSLFNMFNRGKFILGPQMGVTICESSQDCIDGYMACPKEDEVPTCVKHGPRGILDKPYCGCRNPNKEY